ncbi:hypothetical protein SAMN05421736_112155, partial [Evansella caseinilytica]
MKALIYKQLKKTSGQFLLTIVVLALLITFIPMALSTLQFADRTVQLEINDFARGSYDLLVRPADASSELEEKIGIVEENYLGVGEGGISLAEWKDILDMEEVDTAAPVASLGYFTPSQLSFALPLIEDPVRYTATFHTTDGLQDYVIREDIAYSLPHPNSSVYGRDAVITEDQINVFSEHTQGFLLPLSYHPIVAVDPDEEKKLTGIDYYPIKATNLTHPMHDGEMMPVVNIKETEVPIKAEILIERLGLTEEESTEMIGDARKKLGVEDINQPLTSAPDDLLYLEFYRSLHDIESVDKTQYIYDFTNKIAAMNETRFYIDEDYNLLYEYEYDFDVHGESGAWGFITYYYVQNVFYRLSNINYQIEEGNIRVPMIAEHESGVPIYRELTEIQRQDIEDFENNTYFTTVGEISVSENENTLAASPLGIYNYEETTYQGKTV